MQGNELVKQHKDKDFIMTRSQRKLNSVEKIVWMAVGEIR